MIKLLKKGIAVFLSGEFYMNSYLNETGTRSHCLVIELGNLKFCLRDSQNLIADKLKDQKEKDEQQEAKKKSF